MKTLVLILAMAAFAAAGPVPDGEEKDEGSDIPVQRQQMQLDLEELDLEYFPNGTVRQSGMSDLIRLYHSKQGAEDNAGNKTQQHYEEEEDDEIDENGDIKRSKRTVFDDDERLPIPNGHLTSSLPYCALAEVSNGCTAIFVGPYHALTAGRCVYDRTYGQFYKGLLLYRGRNCYKYGTVMTATRLFTVKGYATSNLREYDYGLIVTSQRSPCWASLGYRDPWNNWGFDLNGYPTDKKAANTGCSYDSAYSSSCHYSITSRSGLYLQHRCDSKGMIGAPLMSEIVDQVGVDRGQRAVYGVNSYNGIYYNYGPRINRDRFYQIIDWMQQTGYNPILTN